MVSNKTLGYQNLKSRIKQLITLNINEYLVLIKKHIEYIYLYLIKIQLKYS